MAIVRRSPWQAAVRDLHDRHECLERFGQAMAHPDEAHAHVVGAQILGLHQDVAAEDPHQAGDLVGRPPPVLGREGVEREMRHAEVGAGLDDAGHPARARHMSGDAAEAPRGRPPPVAVHDDPDVEGSGRLLAHSCLRFACGRTMHDFGQREQAPNVPARPALSGACSRGRRALQCRSQAPWCAYPSKCLTKKDFPLPRPCPAPIGGAPLRAGSPGRAVPAGAAPPETPP
jgi:hypothetical protein